MSNKFTEGLKKLPNGKYRLIEDVVLNNETMVEKISVNKLTESVGGVDLQIYGKYTAKVWCKHGLNKNKRNYANVFDIAMETYCTDGLANHPEGDEWPVEMIFAVENNPRIIDDWFCVDVTLVGDLGRLAQSILVAGGSLRFSSCCDGDLDSQGNVLREGFGVCRFLDWVGLPSNGVYNYLDDLKLKENVDKTSKTLNEDSTKLNNIQELTILKEQETKMENRLQESVEKILTQNLSALLKSVDTETSIKEKKNLLEQVISEASNLTDKALLEKASKKKAEVDKELEEMAEKGKEAEALKDEIKKKAEETTGKEKEIEDLKEAINTLTDKYNSLVRMYESKQYEASDSELQLVEMLSKKVKLLSQSNLALKEKFQSDKKVLLEKVEYYQALGNTKVDSSKVVALQKEISQLKESLAVKNSKLREATQIINEQKIRLIESRKAGLRTKPLKEGFSGSRRTRLIEKDLVSDEYAEVYANSQLDSFMDAQSKNVLLESERDNDFEGYATRKNEIGKDEEVKSSKLNESYDPYDDGDEEMMLKASDRLDGLTVKGRITEA